ncbi:GIY-YIG nuclease family protein [Cryomorpha ignava]|uniref:GIY-YIG nuclease family protein n=1 Tax=Cryomorpha ignava TaxID=101383 RepID=A0A7K3WT24_9FLAO|nr:GIY-YIG nuclease family protein [Cryomorpha ignava]NEN24201.1 GIY-YIG nuclease family protein [Cryomorpha ignava]
MLTFQEIIENRTDVLKNANVKLVRHKDNRTEYRDILKDEDKLLQYQKEQAKEVFKGIDYIVSFIGQEGTKALLFGIFKVGEVTFRNNQYYYELTKVDICEDLVKRVVIDWGKAAISWHQKYDKQPKEIVEILPAGYIGTFPGLTNFVLDFSELQKLVNNPDANRDWKLNLSAVDGIYLILDTNTEEGRQYVGSARGKDGIWGRWMEYSKNSHGNNKQMVTLHSLNLDHAKGYKFSILQALPSNLTQKEIEKIEKMYKEKLGTKMTGLNSN